MSETGIIYCITRRLTGQKYVGLTTTHINHRWSCHVSQSRKPHGRLAQAIIEDGRAGFDIETLESGIARTSLCERERYWIAKLGTLHPGGLNSNKGGSITNRKSTGFARNSEALAKDRGVNLNTARRWVREGIAPNSARVYRKHGATGSVLFKRWHSMFRRALVESEWHSFERFVADISTGFSEDKRIIRPDRKKPWGPDNFAFVPGWITNV